MFKVEEYGFANVNQETLSKFLQNAKNSLPLLKRCLQKHDDLIAEYRDAGKFLQKLPISLGSNEKSDEEFRSLAFTFRGN